MELRGMRSVARPIPLGRLVAIIAVVSACGGPKEQDVLAESSSGTSSSGGTSGTSGTSGSSGSSGTSTSSSSSSGSSGVTDGGKDAASACPAETEPNDGKNTANTLAPTLCGTLQPTGDVDFLTFKLKSTTTLLSLKYDGRITLTVTVEGGATAVLGGGGGGGGNQTVPFVQGKPYFVEIRAVDKNASVPWRVDLIESP